MVRSVVKRSHGRSKGSRVNGRCINVWKSLSRVLVIPQHVSARLISSSPEGCSDYFLLKVRENCVISLPFSLSLPVVLSILHTSLDSAGNRKGGRNEDEGGGAAEEEQEEKEVAAKKSFFIFKTSCL